MTASAEARPRDLVVFTTFYPYGDYDSYIDEEIRVLAESFRRVLVVSGETEGKPARPHPPNVVARRFNPSRSWPTRLASARFLAAPDCRGEIARARRIGGASFAGAARHVLDARRRADEYLGALRDLFADHRLLAQDTVIYNYWMLDNAHASALFKKTHPGVVVVSRAHSTDLYFDRSPIGYLPFKRACFAAFEAVFFISERGREYFRQRHPVDAADAHKLRLARLGVTDSGLGPAPAGGRFRLVSNAFLSPIKRIDLIAHALARISRFEVEWVHFGDMYGNPAGFQAFQDEVRRVLRDRPNVRVDFRGRTPLQSILDYYRRHAVDLFVNVSTTEGLPVSLMEAVSFGIPIAATAVGGNPEIVAAENGLLLPADLTPAVLADAVESFQALGDDHRAAYRRAARRTWEERFDATRNYREFAEELRTLTARPPETA